MVDEAKMASADGAARCVLAVRRMMRETISAELVLNPAIDMLFALYLNRASSSTWQDVCTAVDVSEDTCRRWGRALADRGLVEIGEQGYRLTEEGRRVMANVNERTWQIAANYLSADLQPPPE